MKLYTRIKWTLLLLLLPAMLWAQKQERQTGDTTYYPSLIPEAKQGLLKNVNVIANMNFALRNEFVDGEHTMTRFRNEQFRLEIRGQVHEKVYFRFRDRYTRAQTSESIDNLSRSVDLAYLRFDINEKFSVSAGKMCADWGAWEFDWNPIDIYEYSDIVEYADNFLTGVGFTYTASSRNQWTFQVLDSRTKTFDELYGESQPNFTESKAPLAFVANWRGSLFGGKLKTIWSYSLFNEAQDLEGNSANMNYIALGNELNFGKFRFIYDFKWSDEELDRTSIVSETIKASGLYDYSVANTLYIGHWINLRYQLSPKVAVTFVGMLDIAKWNNSFNDPANATGEEHIRDAWGYIPAVEYTPWSDLNLRFFANWVGRDYKYSNYAKSNFGAVDYTTGRFTVGFISPLGIL
jgi:hypothetical protein